MESRREIRNQRDGGVHRDVGEGIRDPGEFQKKLRFRTIMGLDFGNRSRRFVNNRQFFQGHLLHAREKHQLQEVKPNGNEKNAFPTESFHKRAAGEIGERETSGPHYIVDSDHAGEGAPALALAG